MHRAILVLTLLALAIGLERPATAGNIVINGGFETGDFTGWTTTGSPTVSGADFNGVPYTGTYKANLASSSTGDAISQTLATLANQSYSLTFWAAADASNSFTVDWNGSLVAGSPTSIGKNRNDNQSIGDYSEYTLTVTAVSTSTALEFSASNSTGSTVLDDVSVTPNAAVPEPASIWMMAVGAVGLAGLGWRHRGCRA